MVIQGTIACEDSLILNQNALVDIKTNSDVQDSDCFVIGRTIRRCDSTTSYYQGQLLNTDTGFSLFPMAPRLIGWTYSDGTYIDGTYTEPRPYNPIEISYGIYTVTDGTSELDGYRFRDPLNPKVGQFYANMETPSDVGDHKIQWLYKKDQSSLTVAVDQCFTVTHWGNQDPSYVGFGAITTLTATPYTFDKHLGDSAEIELVIDGALPAPVSYLWRKRGINMVDTSNFSGTDTDTLTINSLTEDDFTYYECVVSDVYLSSRSWIIEVVPLSEPLDAITTSDPYEF